ncbi:exo-alpha-sialidase [Paenibacillus mesophilus]|uniref:sialidase family protein n=1 Tax=Paenibacillus mesophilus TaxID=2582849 RepID=UPI00110ECFBD|nr:sialidase family protein [Paenibacillus mesophilus]TMV51588.1 exo-alpha-sialidase [Paenibacillus mesophilus]
MNTELEHKDTALAPAAVTRVTDGRYAERRWQGIPGVEIADNGRLWATFYSGGDDEGPDNYVALVTSVDGGSTWSDIRYVVDPPGKVRAYDPCLWHDPSGRLWLFWAQSFGWYDGRCGVFAATCDNSGDAEPRWSEPRRIADGIMMNKPTVLGNGDWLFPIAVWACQRSPLNDLPEERYSNVYRSSDQGATFHKLGFADIPNRAFDEHMVVERNEGSLWMLVRTHYGVGESESRDGGATWTPGRLSPIEGPDSRFFIRRLQSGRLLLVNHDRSERKRSRLTAMLSDDDGQSWSHRLMLDERMNVSYPDGVQGKDGRIYLIYDRERKTDKEILLAVFTEEDVMNGKCVSPGSVLGQIVNKA